MTTAHHPSLRARLRYAFDNSLSRGPVALIGLLGLLSLALVVTGAAVLVLFGLTPGDGGALPFGEAAWQALMRAIDAGGVGADVGWGFRMVMLAITVGGVFVVSILIGVLTTGIEGRLEELRKGRSAVLEDQHTLILGWSQKIFTVIGELCGANENVRRPRIVVLAERDKVAMEDEIRDQLGDRLGRTRVVCRSGNPLSAVDLRIANPGGARSIVVLSPDDERPDRFVLRALLALADRQLRPEGCNHIVATLDDPASEEVAELIAGDDVRLIKVGDLISRITAQTCRQSGLSTVYQELLDFDGVEIYFVSIPELTGRTYHEALLSFEASTVIGVLDGTGTVALNPEPDRRITADDQLIVIAEDDDVTHATTAVAPFVAEDLIAQDPREDAVRAPEHTIVVGWNQRTGQILRHLDAYVVPGSTVHVVAEHLGLADAIKPIAVDLVNTAVTVQEDRPTRRAVLDALPLQDIDHVIVLAEEHAGTAEEADTDTLVSLLHLRDIAARRNLGYSIVTEVLDSRNRELIRTTSADDFIVSDQLVSLLLAQVAEHAHLDDVFDVLFDPAGAEIYLRPAGRYVRADVPTPFSTVVEAAARRGETAIGYRLSDGAGDPAQGYGVVVSPPKSEPVALGTADRVIVIAAG